jgi:hypothetical protein
VPPSEAVAELADTEKVPGWVVILIHGIAELNVEPLNSSCHEVPVDRLAAWNETVPSGAPTSTYAKLRLSDRVLGTTTGLPAGAEPT